VAKPTNYRLPTTVLRLDYIYHSCKKNKKNKKNNHKKVAGIKKNTREQNGEKSLMPYKSLKTLKPYSKS
jgi:hypothetical protein